MNIESESSTLPFEKDGVYFERYEVAWNNKWYCVEYRYGDITISVSPDNLSMGTDKENVIFEQKVGEGSNWTDKEANVYLCLISDAIRKEMVKDLKLPKKSELKNFKEYRYGKIPIHPVGIVCGHLEKPVPHERNMNRHVRNKRKQQGIHDHDINCVAFIPTNLIDEWIKEHPAEHEAFKKYNSEEWNAVKKARK